MSKQTAPDKATTQTTAKPSIYQTVTGRIVKSLKPGVIPMGESLAGTYLRRRQLPT